MRIVDFRLDHPCLRASLERVPAVRIEWVQSDIVDGRTRILIWAEGGNFDEFEGAMDDDPTVEGPLLAVPVGERRLYRLELAGNAAEADMYPVLLDSEGFIQHLTASPDGWDFRVAFPDGESVLALFEFFSEHDLDYEVHRLFEERGASEGAAFGLTEKQADVLVTALETGYLDVPREAHLEDLSEAFDISDTSVSERLRRGMKTLIENTIATEQQ